MSDLDRQIELLKRCEPLKESESCICASKLWRSLWKRTMFRASMPLLLRAKIDGNNCLRSLKQVSCGAAPLSEKSINDFNETLPHVNFIQGYGMTESTAAATHGYNTAEVRKYSSVGFLSPNVEAKVVDWVTGCHLPPGSIGELWLRSPGNIKDNMVCLVGLSQNMVLTTIIESKKTFPD